MQPTPGRAFEEGRRQMSGCLGYPHTSVPDGISVRSARNKRQNTSKDTLRLSSDLKFRVNGDAKRIGKEASNALKE